MVSCRGGLALVLCAALACGGSAGPRHPAALVGSTKHYQPLGMRDDARVAGQAVILGTDPADGSTVLPLSAVPASVVVQAIVAGHGGALIAITLGAAPVAPVAEPSAEPARDASPAESNGRPANPATTSDAATPGGGERTTNGTQAAVTTTTAIGSSAPTTPSTGSSVVANAAKANAASPANLVIVHGLIAAGASESPGVARWNAGLWSAALVASAALGKDLPDLAFSATPAGPAEGIAASALIAAGFLAALTGAPIDPAATLAGTINPDGALGPVAGLPELMLAAIAHGKTRIGFPGGMRVAKSEAGAPIDLVKLARDHHAEAVELATVHDAYRLLTGRPLPAPVPVGELDMALDADSLRGVEALVGVWQLRLAGEWAALLQLEQAGRQPAAISGLARLAKTRSEQAEALRRTGKLPAAYGRMRAAWIAAAGANRTYAVLARLTTGSVDGALTALAGFAPGDGELAAVIQRIGAQRPTGLAGHLGMVAAFEAALRGWAYQTFAGDAVRAASELLTGFQGKAHAELGAPATADAVTAAVAPAIVMTLRATAAASAAEQELALVRDPGLAFTASPHGLARLAAAHQAAIAATLGYADALAVDPRAPRSRDLARRQAAAAEPELLIAGALAGVPADGLPHEATTAWGDAAATSLLVLAGHAAALHAAGVIIARHDGLAVRLDAAGTPIAVGSPEALRQLLVTAARAARAAARAARIATGSIPLAARLAYQLAATEAAGTLDDQLAALADLWAATDASRLAAALARN